MACAGCLVALSGFGDDSAPSTASKVLPALIGAALGAAIGAVAVPQSRARAAVFAGGAGALLGYVVGNVVTLQKQAQVTPDTGSPFTTPPIRYSTPIPVDGGADTGSPFTTPPILSSFRVNPMTEAKLLPSAAEDQSTTSQWSGPAQVTLPEDMASIYAQQTSDMSDQLSAASSTGAGGGLQLRVPANVGAVAPTTSQPKISCPAGFLANTMGGCDQIQAAAPAVSTPGYATASVSPPSSIETRNTLNVSPATQPATDPSSARYTFTPQGVTTGVVVSPVDQTSIQKSSGVSAQSAVVAVPTMMRRTQTSVASAPITTQRPAGTLTVLR